MPHPSEILVASTSTTNSKQKGNSKWVPLVVIGGAVLSLACGITETVDLASEANGDNGVVITLSDGTTVRGNWLRAGVSKASKNFGRVFFEENSQNVHLFDPFDMEWRLIEPED